MHQGRSRGGSLIAQEYKLWKEADLGRFGWEEVSGKHVLHVPELVVVESWLSASSPLLPTT
jgi:hypothetical protein